MSEAPACGLVALYTKSTGRVLIRLGQPSAPTDIGAVFEARCQERDDPGEVALGRGFRSRESELGPFVPVEQRGVARPAVGVGPAAVARGPALDELSALLALLLSHRSAAALRNAEPSLCAISIVGGCVADLSVAWMLGEVSTPRCHGLASWSWAAATLLYGPLILQSYRVYRVRAPVSIQGLAGCPLPCRP